MDTLYTLIKPYLAEALSLLFFLIQVILAPFLFKKIKAQVSLIKGLVDILTDVEYLTGEGEKKLNIALTKAENLCHNLGIKYNKQKVLSWINLLISLTKRVNARTKDFQALEAQAEKKENKSSEGEEESNEEVL